MFFEYNFKEYLIGEFPVNSENNNIFDEDDSILEDYIESDTFEKIQTTSPYFIENNIKNFEFKLKVVVIFYRIGQDDNFKYYNFNRKMQIYVIPIPHDFDFRRIKFSKDFINTYFDKDFYNIDYSELENYWQTNKILLTLDSVKLVIKRPPILSIYDAYHKYNNYL